jgi:hypothetical protein
VSRKSSCRGWNGLPKRGYDGKAQAEGGMRAWLKSSGASPELYGVYHCEECDKWHFGRNRQYKPTGRAKRKNVGKW